MVEQFSQFTVGIAAPICEFDAIALFGAQLIQTTRKPVELCVNLGDGI